MPTINQGLPVKIGDLDATKAEATATTLGKHFNQVEDFLLQAYALKEGTPNTDSAFKTIAAGLGISSSTASIRSLQLIAEQRFQRASQMMTLFSGLLDKVDQMKQRIIAKFAN
jgi:hypothetical protein